MALINGTNLVLKIGGVPILKATTASLEISVDMPDATTKDSAGWAEFFAGVRSWTVSSDGLVDYTSGANVQTDELVTMLINRSTVNITFTTGASGDAQLAGTAYVTSISQTADMESPAGFSVTLQGTGALTQTIIA